MLYATTQYIQMITSALAMQTGVSIYESDKWATDIKTNTLYYDATSLRSLPFYVVKGILLHEISHLLHTDNPVFKPDYEQRFGIPSLMEVYNMIEDPRIERLMVEKYGHYAEQSFASAFAFVVEKNMSLNLLELTKLQQFLFVAFLNFFYEYNLHGVANEIYNIMNWSFNTGMTEHLFDPQYNKLPVEQVVFDRYYQNKDKIYDIIEHCHKLNSTQESIDYADQHLIPFIEDFLEEDKKDQEEKGEGKGQGQGDQDGDGQAKQPMTLSSLKDQIDQAIKGQLAGKGPAEEYEHIDKPTEQEAITILKPYINTLSQRLQSILQEKAHTRWRGNHLSGKLLNKNAYKITIPNETRVFSKKTTPDNPHYHIYLMLDSSGSMGGKRGLYAYLGGVLIQEVSRQLRFKLTMMKYDDSVEDIRSLENDYDQNGGGTNDFYAFNKINKMIDPQENNLIFVLTDGETTRLDERQEVLDTLEKKKNALIFGVGIGKDINLQTIIQQYKQGIAVSEVSKVPQKLIEVIRSIIKR